MTTIFYLHNSLYTIATDHIFMQYNLEKRMDATMSQSKGRINKNWILLDSQSTVDLFSNRELLTNLRRVRNTLTIHCNAGTVNTNIMGDLPGYGPVWYYKDGIANILSLYLVGERFNVEYNNRTSEDFTV